MLYLQNFTVKIDLTRLVSKINCCFFSKYIRGVNCKMENTKVVRLDENVFGRLLKEMRTPNEALVKTWNDGTG